MAYSYTRLVEDHWRYKRRELTRPPQYITIGRAPVRVVGYVDTGRVDIPKGTTLTIATVPPGEIWYVYHIAMDYVSNWYIEAGGRAARLAEFTGSTGFVLDGGWAVKARAISTVNGWMRLRALKLDPDWIEVFGGVYSVPANTTFYAYEHPTDAYHVFTQGSAYGDGTNSGRVRLMHGYHGAQGIDLATGTGIVQWFGARDDFVQLILINESESTENCLCAGIKVREW